MAKSPGKPVVVYHGATEEEAALRRFLMAIFFSFFLNGILIGGLVAGATYFKVLSPDAVAGETVQEVVESDVDSDQPAPNLEEDEIGVDPSVKTNYNNDRIEEVSVPGPVNKDEQVGIPDMPAMAPTTLPPPPGVGSTGTGGSVESATMSGVGAVHGPAGGFLNAKLVPGGFGGRSGSTRVKMLTEGGGNTFSEAAVASGLKFLSEHQAPDGHWSIQNFSAHGKCNCTGKAGRDNDIAGTALALLPFLGSGQTHKGGSASGNKYTKRVDGALKYLILKQNRNGEFHPNMYAQGLATMTVCEAYGLTSDPALRGPAMRGIRYIIEAQSSEGGWRYARKSAGYDTSVSGWQVMALKSAQMSGITVPAATLNRCKKWLDHAGTADGGGYGYVANSLNDQRPNETITLSAVGLLCRQYLGWGPRNPGLLAGARRVQTAQPQINNMYYTYYATQIMHHLGGPSWDAWNVPMRDGLIAAQDKGTEPQHGHQKGSWFNPADNISGGQGGRIMNTSLSILCLEVYYRHLPLYRRDVGGDKDVMNDK